MLLKCAAERVILNSLRVLLFRIAGVKIGKGCYISRHARIGPNVTIGNNVVINACSRIHDCIIENDVIIGSYSEVYHTFIGHHSEIGKWAQVHGYKDNRLEIGNNVGIGTFCVLDGTGGLKIGNKVSIGHSASIFTHSNLKGRLLGATHGEKDNIERKEIKIFNCVWIGPKVTIQLGVEIGDHSGLMPNSTITRSVNPYTLVSGCPAKPIKKIIVKGNEVSLIDI